MVCALIFQPTRQGRCSGANLDVTPNCLPCSTDRTVIDHGKGKRGSRVDRVIIYARRTTCTAPRRPAEKKKAILMIKMTSQLLTVIDSGPLPRFWIRRVRLSPVGLHDVAQKILQYCRSNIAPRWPFVRRYEEEHAGSGELKEHTGQP